MTKKRGLLSKLFKKKSPGDRRGFDKDSFVQTFSDPDLFTEFRQFAEADDAESYLKFSEHYTRLEQLVSEHASSSWSGRGSARASEKFQSLGRFLASPEDGKSGVIHSANDCELPVWLVSHFLIFYATFLATGCPCPVVISAEARLAIVSQLESGRLHKLRCNIFDDAADEVLSNLYKFLAHRKGEEMPDLDSTLVPVSYIIMSRSPSSGTGTDSSASLATTESSRMGALFRKRSIASFANERKAPLDVVYTKDCFVRVLYDQRLYKEFEQFMEEDHCQENLMFFESYSRLEKILVENVPLVATVSVNVPVSKTHPNASVYGGFISKFLPVDDSDSQSSRSSGTNPQFQNDNPSQLQSEDIFITSSVYSHFLLFHASYIAPGAPHEVNIPDKMRKKIAIALSSKGGQRVPAHVFEGAVVEVLNLVYLNSFKKFQKQRIPPTPPLSQF